MDKENYKAKRKEILNKMSILRKELISIGEEYIRENSVFKQGEVVLIRASRKEEIVFLHDRIAKVVHKEGIRYGIFMGYTIDAKGELVPHVEGLHRGNDPDYGCHILDNEKVEKINLTQTK